MFWELEVNSYLLFNPSKWLGHCALAILNILDNVTIVYNIVSHDEWPFKVYMRRAGMPPMATPTFVLGLPHTDVAVGVKLVLHITTISFNTIMHFKSGCLMVEQHLIRPPHTFGPHSSIQVHSQSATAYPLFACLLRRRIRCSFRTLRLACVSSFRVLFRLAVTG